MITAATARQHQQAGRKVVDARYRQTRTFPTRYVASPLYRTELTAEMDTVFSEQVDRIVDRLNMMEEDFFDQRFDLEDADWTGRIPTREWPLRTILTQTTWLSRMEREYDFEVRK